jgi:hypothetical protein
VVFLPLAVGSPSYVLDQFVPCVFRNFDDVTAALRTRPTAVRSLPDGSDGVPTLC